MAAGDEQLSLQEAAQRLGVHYMTAYRYVRLGLLPATKEGATWRVSPHDVEVMRAGEVQGRGRVRRAPWAERLENRLLAGDEQGAWGVVESALSAGTSLPAMYLDVLGESLRRIGEAWERGAIDVADEHRASVIAMRVVGRLGPRFARRGRSRGAAVVGAPPGERHGLPSAMLADLVRGAGFGVVDLGADVPVASWLVGVDGVDRLVAVAVGVTTSWNDAAVADTVTALHEVLDGVPVLVGGRAIDDEDHARRLGADRWAPDAPAVLRILDELTGRA